MIRAEIRKLATTRALPYTLLGTTALSVLTVVLTASAAGKNGAAPLGSTANIHQMLKLGAVACVAMLVLGITASGGEYRHRTIVPSLLVAPQRPRLIVSKCAAVLAAGVVLSTAILGTGVLAVIAVLAAHGIHHLPPDTARTVAGSIVGASLFGLIGTALGFIARSTVGAVVGAVSWVLFGELTLLKAVAPHLAKWLPTANVVTLTDPTAHGSAYLAAVPAAVLLAGYALLAISVATVFVARRDVA